MLDNFKYHIKRGVPFIFMILLLLFFPALMFLRKNGFVFFEKKVRKEALRWAHQDSISVADSLKKNKIESKIIEKIQQDSLVKTDKEEHPVFAGDIRDTYYIIAGSFLNPENAKLAARKYRSLGYKTSIISITNPYGIKTELVSVKTFNNFDEAARYLSEFKSKFDPSAWIYSKK
jgi:SPOR domain